MAVLYIKDAFGNFYKIQTIKGDTGLSPHIDPGTGHWFVGNEDTGYSAIVVVDWLSPVFFTAAINKENIVSGDTIATLFGKISKWYTSFGTLAWKSSVNYTTEITNLPTIPDQLSDLMDDATHRLVTDAEKTYWNGKANLSDIPNQLSDLSDDSTHRLTTDTEKSYWDGKANMSDIPTVPDQLSDLLDDSTHRTVTDTEKSYWNGKADLVDGLVPASQLPSFVDAVVDSYIVSGSTEFSSGWLSLTDGGLALTPEDSKVYIVLTAGAYQNKTYRWSGTVYAVIGNDLTLGTTSTTAFRGDYGNTAYLHSQVTGGVHVTSSDRLSWDAKQSALNGTGFVKISGTTISYDTNTYLTGITSQLVTAALGFTPYNATNPAGYTTNVGTVTSVGLSVPTGLSVASSPITTSGTIALSFANGYSIPTNAYQSNWNTAYSHVFLTNNPHSVTYAQVGAAAVDHDHASTYLGINATAYDSTRLNGQLASYYSIASHNHNSIYQSLDADLTAIAALTGTSGFLKKTDVNTWSLDTTSYVSGTPWTTMGYLTGITSNQVTTALGFTPYNSTNPSGYISSISKSMVEAVLTGAITSHTHSYEPPTSE